VKAPTDQSGLKVTDNQPRFWNPAPRAHEGLIRASWKRNLKECNT